MPLSKLGQTPWTWIAKAVADRGLSQRSLARALGIDASRFNRWIHGEEQIPRAYLLELAQHFHPADIAYLLRLKDCEDLSDQLHRRLQVLSECTGLGDHLVAAIRRQVDNLVTQEHPPGSPGHLDTLLRLLIDAAGAALIVQRVVDVDFHEPLLLPPTVARFRYPINHFLGTFLDLDSVIPAKAREAQAVSDFRERLLRSLRTVGAGKPSRQRWQELARQFSVHVLARHGTDLDRKWVHDMLFDTSAPVDPLLRRISFTGVILGGEHANMHEKFLQSLQRNNDLSKSNLFFNAFHYGDATFAADGSLPRSTKTFRNALPNIIRHLEQPDRYGSIVNIEAWTLVELLEAAGPKPFLQRSVLSRLSALLSPESRLVQQLDLSVRRPFQRRFSQLIKTAS